MEPSGDNRGVSGVEATTMWNDPISEPVPIIRVNRDFTSWYRDARPQVARALALTLGDAELATDAVDEAMTRAYQRWNRVGDLDNPGGWVYRVALNWSRSILRRRRRPTRIRHEVDVPGPSAPEPAIAKALDALSVDHRAVVVCRFLLGWSEAQTAEALGIKPGTVKSRTNRALGQMQNSLGHLRPRTPDSEDDFE